MIILATLAGGPSSTWKQTGYKEIIEKLGSTSSNYTTIVSALENLSDMFENAYTDMSNYAASILLGNFSCYQINEKSGGYCPIVVPYGYTPSTFDFRDIVTYLREYHEYRFNEYGERDEHGLSIIKVYPALVSSANRLRFGVRESSSVTEFYTYSYDPSNGHASRDSSTGSGGTTDSLPSEYSFLRVERMDYYALRRDIVDSISSAFVSR